MRSTTRPAPLATCWRLLSLVLALAAPASAGAQAPPPTVAAFTPSFSLRTRAESWDWFDSGAGGRYAFVGALARGGFTWQRDALALRLELAAPILLGLPDDALAPAPAGQLGLGPAYFAATDSGSNVVGLFPKQLYVELDRAGGHRVRLGRTEFVDGSERAPKSPTLQALKRDRIAHRLIGTFGWTHVGRSFDGVAYGYTRPAFGITALAARATRGAFDAAGLEELPVGLGYVALTGAAPWDRSSDARLFALYYRDDRSLPKVDARPAAVRALDSTEVSITTLGGHVVQEIATGVGSVDLLAWGAVQRGSWGRQDHRAGALALEAGIQPSVLPALHPWLRAGYYRASGDGDPGDGRHESYFPVLPTARVYARFPFYTLTNVEEAFGSLQLRPGTALGVRSDLRFIGLAERADLWYAGGGAFERESFGYAGRPGGGARALATLLDLSIEWRPSPRVTVIAYGAHAWGRGVTRSVYGPEARGAYGYLELELRR